MYIQWSAYGDHTKMSGAEANGDLSLTDNASMKTGFLSLVRVFGTVYFKKNLATVVSRLGFETPSQLYNSMTQIGIEEKYIEWYLNIRRVIPILSEDQRPPTLTSLWRHWMRSCWIKHMLENSSKADQYHGLAPPESQGWSKGWYWVLC